MFNRHGITILVDGQYGSTGKGVIAAALASRYARKVEMVVSNAGPNSGHTFYHGSEKHVLKQLPTFAVAARLRGIRPVVYLCGGAIIDPVILEAELEKYDMNVILSPQAAVITPEDKAAEGSGTVAAVAGTRSGTGAAIARKVLRDPSAVAQSFGWSNRVRLDTIDDFSGAVIFGEVSQGFSLGINGSFYPKTTSRECTAAQLLADARIAPQLLSEVVMSIRTFPIRVGNFEGNSSGGCYPDQKEISWEELGETPELTTVTQRVRRIFTFSDQQFRDALAANRPRYVFVNFMNYIKGIEERRIFADRLRRISRDTLGRMPTFYYGNGPLTSDVTAYVE